LPSSTSVILRLRSTQYTLAALDLDEALAAADLVIVHEWNEHELVRRVGKHRADKGGYRLFFHDTHHRAITSPSQMQGYDLSGYDGVLAYGQVLRELYMQRDWTRHAWTWHEAADTRVFHPIAGQEREGDVVWIGNWGDDERSAELDEFLVEPIAVLGLKAKIFGVRYPDSARERLRRSGIEYGGWLANYRAPEVFARYKMTVHVPRGPTWKRCVAFRPFGHSKRSHVASRSSARHGKMRRTSSRRAKTFSSRAMAPK
jgi:spore maturation protein CgeB